MKRDVLWENGLQMHLIFKKRRNFAKWQNFPFRKGIKTIQKMTLNTHKRCFRGKQLEKPLNIKRMTRF